MAKNEGRRGKPGGKSGGGPGGKGGGAPRGKSRKGGRGGGRGGSQSASQYGSSSKEERTAYQKQRKAKIESDLRNLKDKKKEERVPLEESVYHVRNELSGEIEAVKDLDRRWIGELSFLEYLPGDNDSPEAEEVLRYLNRDLRELLLAPYHVFWSYVLLDKAFGLFLDSFLRYFAEPVLPLPDLRQDPESLDADGLRGQLFERVFLVVCRITQMEESTYLFMTSQFYTQELTKSHLVDLPKLIDIARLYGCHNSQKVTSTLKFLFYQMPRLKRDFKSALTVVAEELDRAGDAAFDESGTTDMQGVLGALVDIVFTLATFINLAPNCTVYAVRDNRQVINLLVYTHDAVAPRLEYLLSSPAFAEKLAKLRKSAASLVHAVLERCYLGPLLLGRDKRNFVPNDAAREVAELISGMPQVVSSFASLKGHAEPLATGSLLMELERTHAIANSLRKAAATAPSQKAAIDAALAVVPAVEEAPAPSVPSATTVVTETDRSAESEWKTKRKPLVNMVKEIVGPDYGEGFIDKCLQHYNDSVEHVVAHIFDGSLHASLSELDHKLAKPDFTRTVRVAAPAVVPFQVREAPAVADVAKVHYGKKSTKAPLDLVPDDIKGFAKSYASTLADDLLYNDEWDDSFDAQAPVRVAGDTTTDEVSNLSISGTYEIDEEEGEGDDSSEGSTSSLSNGSKGGKPGKGGSKNSSSTRAYAQKRNRKKLAAKKRAV